MKKVFLKIIVAIFSLLSLLVIVAAYEYVRLPDVSNLKYKNPKTTALIELRAEETRRKGLHPKRRQIWVPYNAVAEDLKKAILLSEDTSFFSHRGIDFFELKEAVKKDLEVGKFRRGGSTITMQLARNLYLSPSKNPLRKLREILIAWQLEQALSKKRILELYLNVIEWGRGIYGAEAASQHYFSKRAADLDLLEAASLAALLPNPINPTDSTLRRRRNLILGRMRKVGYISEEEFQKAQKGPSIEEMKMEKRKNLAAAPWRTLSSRQIYNNRWLSLREDQVALPDGRTSIYGVVTCGHCVGILPFIDPKTVLLIKQYRYVAKRVTWEMATGGIQPGESIEEAAQRELGEEVGYRAGRLKWVSTYDTSKSVMDETAHLFIGEELEELKLDPDETEFIEVRPFPFEQVVQMVLASEILDSMTVIAVLHAARMKGI